MDLKKLVLTGLLTSAFYLGTISSLTPSMLVSFIPQALAATKLGDLSKFKKIASETESLVDKGDLSAITAGSPQKLECKKALANLRAIFENVATKSGS